MSEGFRKEFSKTDPDLSVKLQDLPDYPSKVISGDTMNKLLDLIDKTPNGVIEMNKDIKGLVETSTNLGVIETKDNSIELINCKRSSSADSMNSLREKMRSVAGNYSAKVTDSNGYPGWKPNMKSALLDMAKKAWKEMYAEEPQVKAIHAGLECGIIGEKYEGIDMISMGPEINSVHSPDEAVNISSVDKFYSFLKYYLEKLA